MHGLPSGIQKKKRISRGHSQGRSVLFPQQYLEALVRTGKVTVGPTQINTQSTMSSNVSYLLLNTTFSTKSVCTFSRIFCQQTSAHWALFIFHCNEHLWTHRTMCSAMSIARKTGLRGLQWETERSCHSASQWSITGYACRVMTAFQLLSRPLTQGHVGTVAPGPLRQLDSNTVTVLKGLYCETNASPPVRWCALFLSSTGWKLEISFFLLLTSTVKKFDQAFSAGRDW